MRYIDNNLLKSEKVIHESRPHWVIFFTPSFLVVFAIVIYFYLRAISGFQFFIFGMPLYKLTTTVVFIVALFTGIKAFIMHQSSEYGVTNKRIIMKTGWIQRRSIEIFVEKVEAIYVDQTILGRILDYGTIIIAGTGGSKDPFLYVPNPLTFRKSAQRQIDQTRKF